MIDHVAHGVYISGYRAIYSAQILREVGITHVLKLYEDGPYWPADFVVCDNPLPDGEPIPAEQLRQGVAFVREQVEAGRSVLVQCGAGISRSSTFVLAFLVDRGYDLKDAWQILKTNHSDANPHPALWYSLIAHYHLPYSTQDVAQWTGHWPAI
ncbi:MAG TPA: dual specificity protein phosphatase [Aggregatilineales bacterium]|nr:dual specificity protein phosphatase [Aggregatilineales bacterium]